MSTRVKYYDGDIWWLPLSAQSRDKLDLKQFTDFLMHHEGRKYDMPQAIRSALDRMDRIAILKLLTYNEEDYAAFFCSELAVAALEHGGVIKEINSSEVTPIDLCRFSLYEEDLYQIKGEETPLNEYNTHDAEGFGMQ